MFFSTLSNLHIYVCMNKIAYRSLDMWAHSRCTTWLLALYNLGTHTHTLRASQLHFDYNLHMCYRKHINFNTTTCCISAVYQAVNWQASWLSQNSLNTFFNPLQRLQGRKYHQNIKHLCAVHVEIIKSEIDKNITCLTSIWLLRYVIRSQVKQQGLTPLANIIVKCSIPFNLHI